MCHCLPTGDNVCTGRVRSALPYSLGIRLPCPHLGSSSLRHQQLPFYPGPLLHAGLWRTEPPRGVASLPQSSSMPTSQSFLYPHPKAPPRLSGATPCPARLPPSSTHQNCRQSCYVSGQGWGGRYDDGMGGEVRSTHRCRLMGKEAGAAPCWLLPWQLSSSPQT